MNREMPRIPLTVWRRRDQSDFRARGKRHEWLFILFVFVTSFGIFALLLKNISPGHAAEPIQITVPETEPKLSLRTNNKLTLAIFSDLHFGEEEHGWGIDQDIKSTRVMRNVLESEDSLDLVVLNGDLITGENTFKENSSAYVDQIVAPMVDKQLPWASTYGNHDSKFNLSREATFKTEKNYPLSYTRQMDAGLPGVTNYYLLVQTADGRPAAVLWFFDSRGGATYQRDPSNEDDIPNWVPEETAAWFSTTSAKLQGQYGRLPSIAFVHIPPHPFLAAQKAELDPALFPGVNDDVPLSIQGEGNNDDAFVDALMQEELLHSIYVGHDHGDAWCALWPEEHGSVRTRSRRKAKRHGDDEDRVGPFLCFSKHTGYGGYGTWDRGARIVQLSLEDKNGDGLSDGEGEMEVQTWVRMEGGDIVTHVALNETYGKDIYPLNL